MATGSGLIEGAAIGFVSAFVIQVFAGHWKLWVDQRKALVDDLVKALEASRAASVKYFEQHPIPQGHQHEAAREAVYAAKVVTDLYGIIDRQFGPVSPISMQSFRQFRELSTGEGFLRGGSQDRKRAADIVVAAATCSAHLREWHCAQLGPVASIRSYSSRKWRNRPRRQLSPAELARLTR